MTNFYLRITKIPPHWGGLSLDVVAATYRRRGPDPVITANLGVPASWQGEKRLALKMRLQVKQLLFSSRAYPLPFAVKISIGGKRVK